MKITFIHFLKKNLLILKKYKKKNNKVNLHHNESIFVSTYSTWDYHLFNEASNLFVQHCIFYLTYLRFDFNL